MNRDGVLAANPLPHYLRNRGFSLYPAGSNFVTNACPVKEHRKLHLCVTIDTAQGLWHCNDHERGGTIIDWEALEKKIEPAEAMRQLSGGSNGAKPPAARPKTVATYDYTDEAGKLRFQCLRYEPKDFKQRRPDDNGGWIWNAQGVRRVLYRLSDVLKAQTICVAEGEKDADNLAKLGFVATTNPFGADKWRDEYSETLRDKDVVIFGDADEPGQVHVDSVIESLTGIARSIKRVTLPDGFHDVSDFTESLPTEAAAQAIAKLIGKAEYQTNREAPKAEARSSSKADDDGTELTSLSSLGAANYPAPIDQVAYYGLAGEIVRRIEPHTEADPAALLFQFLAAFGNLIGHDHYIVADGTRHHLNLYGVLVGQSSKGRKGTSWNHIANVMERVGPEWREERISFGLSSGEGLIWAVRDPIEETKPIREKGRYTGEYETYIANHGEADKRLLIIEAEFANVLKVMAREGNTLSPVIRSAWDSGNLRTIVKNSPSKATNAHISIVGHITRDELRRLLTQTESANGFANRFCWLAVKRSKCLPDGGAIHTVNFENVIAELHSAVDFAKDFVEIARDPEAKKLWHEVYPSLSEAQPGMSGAVIGRAEAQVMRLSAIYALLDKSRLIRPEHHRAASAVWRYCEDSARWIFEIGTGNKNADRILSALKAAGQKGLTKWEITANVFNRNATRYEIDEALRLLHHQELATRKLEKSGGRSAERWFYKAPKHEVNEESPPTDHKTADTSYSSYVEPSQKANSAEADTDPGKPESEAVSGDLQL